MVSAWKYERIDGGTQTTHVKITSRMLKGQAPVTVDDIKLPGFWSSNNEDDVIRHFPAGGLGQFFWGMTQTTGVGTTGVFLSSTANPDNSYCRLQFSAQSFQYTNTQIQGMIQYKENVRLFETVN
jgi:hypothetical protein